MRHISDTKYAALCSHRSRSLTQRDGVVDLDLMTALSDNRARARDDIEMPVLLDLRSQNG